MILHRGEVFPEKLGGEEIAEKKHALNVFSQNPDVHNMVSGGECEDMRALCGYFLRAKLREFYAVFFALPLTSVKAFGAKTIPSASTAAFESKKNAAKESEAEQVVDSFEPASEASNVSGSYLSGSCDEMPTDQKQVHGISADVFVLECSLKLTDSGDVLDEISMSTAQVEMSDSKTYTFSVKILNGQQNAVAGIYRFIFEIPNRLNDLFMTKIALEDVAAKRGVKEIMPAEVKLELKGKLIADAKQRNLGIEFHELSGAARGPKSNRKTMSDGKRNGNWNGNRSGNVDSQARPFGDGQWRSNAIQKEGTRPTSQAMEPEMLKSEVNDFALGSSV